MPISQVKPSKRARDVKMRILKSKAKVILLSGTPTPESYSQIYHQVYGIPNNPFNRFPSFYKFAHAHVKITERMINSLRIRDYSNGLPTSSRSVLSSTTSDPEANPNAPPDVSFTIVYM